MENEILPYSVQLLSVRKEVKRTYTYFFPKPYDFEWDGGVCIQLANTGFDCKAGKPDPENVRHFSIITLVDEDRIGITTRIPESRSNYKDRLRKAGIGDTFLMFNPENRIPLKREGKSIVLVSAGVGIASMRPLIREFAIDQSQIVKLTHINIDSSGEFIFQEELETFENKIADFQNHFTKTREAFYRKLNQAIDSSTFFYLVGSDQFIVDIGKMLLRKSVAIDSIMLDKAKPFYSRLTQVEGFILN